MCDTYVERPELSRDANAILKQLDCDRNNEQLGHCVVWHPERGWNVAGLYGTGCQMHPLTVETKQ